MTRQPQPSLALALCVTVALSTLLACVVLAPAPALAGEACPNEQIRTEQGSAHLPDCRAYEMVSPPYKGGYSANQIEAVAPNGEGVAFLSLGAFAGAPTSQVRNVYLARRDGSGWSTSSLLAPDTMVPFADLVDFSSNFESVLIWGSAGPNQGSASDSAETEFLSHDTDSPDTEANFSLVGSPFRTLDNEPIGVIYEGTGSNLSNIVFKTTGESKGALLPEAEGSVAQLYEVMAGGGSGPSLHFVDLDNQGRVIDSSCRAALGVESGKVIRQTNAVSGDGQVFFTTNVVPGEGAVCSLGTRQLFVRLAGAKTLEVSKPIGEACSEVPCPGAPSRASAFFQGASEDGSTIYFTTAASLVPGAPAGGNALYAAKIGCPSAVGSACAAGEREVTSLAQVSPSPSVGDPAEVQGVVAVSPDGSRVYFVARGTLGAGPKAEGAAPVNGADNLYMYEESSAGPPVFVADLCSGPEVSGGQKDVRCPSSLNSIADGSGINDTNLWLSIGPEAQTSGDGKFLVFSSYGRLTAGDTDAAKDVYRYDAATGVLARVSVGEDGYDTNGNDSRFDAAIALVSTSQGSLGSEKGDLRRRAISEDGTRIVFMTSAPLSPAATNGLANVYEWHEGAVSLISSGDSSSSDEDPLISPSGGDIFFVTSQGLVGQDTDGVDDVYDARLGGGFPPALAEGEECSGDACQGPLTNPAPLLVPGGVSPASSGNFPPPVPVASVKKAAVKKKVKLERKKKKKRKRAEKGHKSTVRRAGRSGR